MKKKNEYFDEITEDEIKEILKRDRAYTGGYVSIDDPLIKSIMDKNTYNNYLRKNYSEDWGDENE